MFSNFQEKAELCGQDIAVKVMSKDGIGKAGEQNPWMMAAVRATVHRFYAGIARLLRCEDFKRKMNINDNIC